MKSQQHHEHIFLLCFSKLTELVAGELLGQENYAQPFLAPNTTGRVILNGVNYASGGGGILNGTGKIFVRSLLIT